MMDRQSLSAVALGLGSGCASEAGYDPAPVRMSVLGRHFRILVRRYPNQGTYRLSPEDEWSQWSYGAEVAEYLPSRNGLGVAVPGSFHVSPRRALLAAMSEVVDIVGDDHDSKLKGANRHG